MLRQTRRSFGRVAGALGLGTLVPGSWWPSSLAAESRRDRTRQRRERLQVIVHRGAVEFAHENTLHAYRASLELGADGNEIDIRATRDGVLVCFHDDMLDHLLEAYGTVSDYDWSELRRIPFRRPGWLGNACRIPTLEEALQLHVEHAGLLHLDVKQPGLGPAIGSLLDRYDLWEQVVAVNPQHGEGLLEHSRYRPGSYKGSLYAERAEVDPRAIAAMLERPGDMVIVDDPRGVLVHLGRPLGAPVRHAGSQDVPAPRAMLPERSLEDLRALLRERSRLPEANAADGFPAGDDRPAREQSVREQSARAIVRRAEAAEEIRRRTLGDATLVAELVRLVEERSLHRDWLVHGLDGAAALRALARVAPSEFTSVARMALWRDDPALEAVMEPTWTYPRAWKDFRTKVIVFPLLEQVRGSAAERLCVDYLALADDEAHRLGPPQFEAAAHTWLSHGGESEVAGRLLTHRRSDVRGRAILDCVARVDDAWATDMLLRHAPHALRYRVSQPATR